MTNQVEASFSGGRMGPALVPESLHVLVVENHSDTRRGIRVFLKSLGYRAAFAENKAQALALAAEQTFDVLLSDISLPDGTGWELLQALVAGGCQPAHAIAMSGLSDVSDRIRSREAGFEIHLVKPFRPEELENALRRASASCARLEVAAKPTATALSGGELRQRLHDGLSQHLVAAGLLQGALIKHLESVLETGTDPTAALTQAMQESRQINRLIDEALEEVLALMRSSL